MGNRGGGEEALGRWGEDNELGMSFMEFFFFLLSLGKSFSSF